jgi:hypothetical protein
MQFLNPDSPRPRTKGAEREGEAAWLAELLTNDKRTINEVLDEIADNGGKVEVGDLPIELHKPDGDLAKSGRITNKYIVHFHYGDKWKQVKVKRLREVAKS